MNWCPKQPALPVTLSGGCTEDRWCPWSIPFHKGPRDGPYKLSLRYLTMNHSSGRIVTQLTAACPEFRATVSVASSSELTDYLGQSDHYLGLEVWIYLSVVCCLLSAEATQAVKSNGATRHLISITGKTGQWQGFQTAPRLWTLQQGAYYGMTRHKAESVTTGTTVTSPSRRNTEWVRPNCTETRKPLKRN